ncbi:hypothetical protein [Montanilutibacter psychrotolerans]|uniref:hypothetical protein n=1 Tax=Montanilutibacter psychrotolerans TaxID=1327343 RepID=UPI001680199E|nr:hypothetical protein [Lysobacter psychrotolerans]
MIPFILKQHEKDRAELKELESIDVDQVSGGRVLNQKLNTVTFTVGGDGADDGADED